MVGHLWIFVSIRWFYLWILRPNVLVCLVIIKRSYGVPGVSLRQNLELLILPGVRRDYLPPHSYTPHPNVFILQNLLIHSFALWKSVGGSGLGALNELSQKQLRVGASTVLQKNTFQRRQNVKTQNHDCRTDCERCCVAERGSFEAL